MIELLHRCLHLFLTGLRVRRVTPKHHGPNLVGVVHVVGVFKNTVDPARHRNAGQVHQVLVLAVRAFHGRELAFQPVEILFPDTGPVRPASGRKAIVAGQVCGQNAKVGRALHVVVAAEDVGAAAGGAHVAKGKLQHAVGARVVVAVGVLGPAHAPDHGAGTVVGHREGHTAQLATGRAGDPLDLFRVPLFHLFLDLVHAPDPGADELFVFPLVLEDMPEDAPDQRHVGAGAEADIFIRMRRGARETRVAVL